jgi:hypothetical protein
VAERCALVGARFRGAISDWFRFPAAATSNGACGSPAHGSPDRSPLACLTWAGQGSEDDHLHTGGRPRHPNAYDFGVKKPEKMLKMP